MKNKQLSDNHRIVKNTLYLYLRMGVSMCVRLYTSRIILQVLGVDDYGLWNVVSGVVVMFSFLNTSMTGCTNRFISYELGHGDRQSLQETFTASMTIHWIIAGVVLVLGETVGLWLLMTQLVIPPDRLLASHIIYQCSILYAMFGITQVPYNATIMAHERMGVYAFVDIANILIRLAFIVGLLFVSCDKLIAIGIFTALLRLATVMACREYCIRRLPCSQFGFSHDWSRIKPMLSFSGWDLYGNAAVLARTQGINVLLNMFFTAAMNAASGVAMNLQNAVMSFGRNVIAAFHPQIFKSYAAGDSQRTCTLVCKGATYTTVLMLFLVVPLQVEMDYVLQLWLGEPPVHAATFSRLILLFYIVIGFADTIQLGIHATGKIKWLSIVNGTLYMSVVPLAYLIFRQGGEAWWAYILCIILALVSLVFVSLHLHRLIPSFSGVRLLVISLRLFILGGLSYVSGMWVLGQMRTCFLRLVLVTLATSFITLLGSYLFVFEASDRHFILSRLRKIVKPLR